MKLKLRDEYSFEMENGEVVVGPLEIEFSKEKGEELAKNHRFEVVSEPPKKDKKDK